MLSRGSNEVGPTSPDTGKREGKGEFLEHFRVGSAFHDLLINLIAHNKGS